MKRVIFTCMLLICMFAIQTYADGQKDQQPALENNEAEPLRPKMRFLDKILDVVDKGEAFCCKFKICECCSTYSC
uniref:Uncharacterized protein n=1 Tax=Acrobeloides nanus TaxID=290746 RepID=A0A914EPC4_9BILA